MELGFMTLWEEKLHSIIFKMINELYDNEGNLRIQYEDIFPSLSYTSSSTFNAVFFISGFAIFIVG